MTISQDEVRAAVVEVADRLAQDAPAVSMTHDCLVRAVKACAPDGQAALYTAVLAALPDVESGQTQGDYGRRVLAGWT